MSVNSETVHKLFVLVAKKLKDEGFQVNFFDDTKLEVVGHNKCFVNYHPPYHGRGFNRHKTRFDHWVVIEVENSRSFTPKVLGRIKLFWLGRPTEWQAYAEKIANKAIQHACDPAIDKSKYKVISASNIVHEIDGFQFTIKRIKRRGKPEAWAYFDLQGNKLQYLLGDRMKLGIIGYKDILEKPIPEEIILVLLKKELASVRYVGLEAVPADQFQPNLDYQQFRLECLQTY